MAGVGYNDGSRPAQVDRKKILEYNLWMKMLQRCYSKQAQEKLRNKSYIACKVSENFKSYSYFYDWCNSQVGFGIPNFELDKDLLVKNNKLYSEDTCIFIPSEINKILTKRKADRGELPIGVSFHKATQKYSATCSRDGKQEHLGVYDTPTLAFCVYKEYKEAILRDKAEQYKHLIDVKAYKALLEYEVEVTD